MVTMEGGSVGENPDISYLYPAIGCICIAIEVLVLCAYLCYDKKKKGVQYEKQRRPSVESGVQEEVVTAHASSNQKSTPLVNHVPTEEEVVQQDRSIFHSYWNLRYIDDVSAENTPEKHLIPNVQL